uniref:Zinc metalloproteinase n=1 Tax=Rhabditophanes sp. KR3021 TaxID=114890 RepID=A0AC35U2X5_9BILA
MVIYLNLLFLLLLFAGHVRTIGDGADTAELKFLLHEIRSSSASKFGIFSDAVIDAGADDMKKATFNDGTEASVNRKVSDDLFENDILLNLDQANDILKEVRGDRKLGKRQAQPGAKYLWKEKTIYYTLANSDGAWRRLIRQALDHLEQETCMRFVEGAVGDHLQYFRGSGCWSNVGRQGGRQQVSIGYGCESKGIVAHETLHALGLWHEQSRYDRDGYVKIDWTKIYRGTQSNFEKRTPLTSDNMDMSYDLGSVMHYGSKAFSTDWVSYSIITKDPAYQQTIGQRTAISYKDARMINQRYCQDKCGAELRCKNNGYTDPNRCSQCRCPSGYSGTLCEQVAPSKQSNCRGGELVAKNTWQTINSPSLYPETDCYWRIKAPANRKIELDISDLSFPCADVCANFLEVKYLDDKSITGARLCCEPPKQSIISEKAGDDIVLHFRGDGIVQSGYLGFTLRYKLITTDGDKNIDLRETFVATTTTTTTQRPTTYARTTKFNGPEWSNWGAWGGCSKLCGGCGTRSRVRACYGGNRRCPGSDESTEPCNTHTCGAPAPRQNVRCTGRLVMPCDLMSQLDFGTTRDRTEDSSFADPSIPMTPKNVKIINQGRRVLRRGKRFVDGDAQLAEPNICSK